MQISLYVGTQEGRLFRISNIALAYNEERADVGSEGCIIATHELILSEILKLLPH